MDNGKKQRPVKFADSVNLALSSLVANVEKEAENTPNQLPVYTKGMFKIAVLNTQVLAELAQKMGVTIS